MKQGYGMLSKGGLTGIEHGHIYFFYQPRENRPKSINDVRMLYCILHPFEGKNYRLLTIDTKRFPISGTEPSSGHVTKVDGKGEVLKCIFRGTMDRSVQMYHFSSAPVRQCGDGVYTIAIRESRTVMAYMIDTPGEERDISEKFGIKNEGHFGLGIQNPWHSSTNRDNDQPMVPDSLKSSFEGDRIIYTMIPLLLNYERMQVVFARTDSFMKLSYVAGARDSTEEPFSELFEDLESQREKFPIVSLFEK